MFIAIGREGGGEGGILERNVLLVMYVWFVIGIVIL